MQPRDPCLPWRGKLAPRWLSGKARLGWQRGSSPALTRPVGPPVSPRPRPLGLEPPHRETRSPGPQWLLHLRSGMPFVRLLPAPRGPSPALTRHPGGPSGSRTSRPGPGRCCAAVPGPVGWRSHPTGPGSQFHWLPAPSHRTLGRHCPAAAPVPQAADPQKPPDSPYASFSTAL